MPVPESWQVSELGGGEVQVEVNRPMDWMFPSERQSEVNAAGQLPSGFDPRALYPARSHPRGLQMTVFGASDAIASLGMDWDLIRDQLSPDQVSVYAGSGMGQLDAQGNGGMLSSRAIGKRVTSKQCPFGFAEMPADFINAYILGSVGNTGTSMGACASFLYNLRQAVTDIQTGRARIAIVGNAEAPITSEIIDGYAAMGALATDAELRSLDDLPASVPPDHRRACRPFAENCGFTIAESAQFLVLCDDELALQLGANVHGAVADVFVNADGYKKSIASPGVGNYLTVARALACMRELIGEQALRHRTMVQAHGTGTPQNRVTESHILDEAARVFGIENWPVAAVKCFLGHSIGAAAGDQVAATLGLWAHGIIPGIATIEAPAQDVHCKNLIISPQHLEVGAEAIDAALINAKGFGGNNASAVLLAPHRARKMIEKRHGKKQFQVWQERNEAVEAASIAYDEKATAGELTLRYRFDHGVLGGDQVDMSMDSLSLSGFGRAVALSPANRYEDML